MIERSSSMDLVKFHRDLTRPISPKWWFSKRNPLISGKSRLVKYYSIWPDYCKRDPFFFGGKKVDAKMYGSLTQF